MDRTAAQRLIVKLRRFTTETLDEDERAVFAALLAPALEQAYAPEVLGYDAEPAESALPLADALMARLSPDDPP